jgi:hypothetical protein
MIRTNTRAFVRYALALVAALLLASPLHAQTPVQPVKKAAGKPTVFKVTVTKVELYNGTSYVTLFAGSAQLDLVAAAGASAFPGISNLKLPAGTYSQIRVTFANSFGVGGSLIDGETRWYCTSTAVPDTGGAAAQGSADSTLAGEASLLNPDWGVLGASVVQVINIPSITVTSATDYQPTIKFDVTNSLVLWEVAGISHYFTLAPITITIL